MPLLNPFLYGKPVPPPRFVGRREAVRTLFSRLNNGESTAIVGEPRGEIRNLVDGRAKPAQSPCSPSPERSSKDARRGAPP